MSKVKKPVNYKVSKRFIASIVLLILLFPIVLLPFTQYENNWDGSLNTDFELNSDIDSQYEQDSNKGEFLGTTRGSRAQDIENNNHPWNANNIASLSNEDITGAINPGDDIDWFKVNLEVDFDQSTASEKFVQNLTLSVSSLTGTSNHFFQIQVYGILNIDENRDIDWGTEMIFMKAETYAIGSPGSTITFANSYASGNYYFKFITDDDAIANYIVRLNVNTIYEPSETNQDIKHFLPLYAYPDDPKTHGVVIDVDPFDWFRVKSPATIKNEIGLNFTLSLKIEDCPPMESRIINGRTIHFVTVLHILVFHEYKLGTGNVPTVPFKFRDHLRISRQSYTGLYWKTQYSDVLVLPSKLFRYTYLGFYVESYGIESNNPDDKLYPFITELGELVRTWCSFTIEYAKTSTVTRPELKQVTVKSTTTNSIYGRTYDNYKYSVMYKQSDNIAPIITDVSVFGLDGEIREKMYRVTPFGRDIYKDGSIYEVIISGLLLGEGDNHVFQLHFKDNNAWANGTIELGMSWHGPYISNNLQPYVRPTAPTKFTLHEDDNTTYFDLNTIFEDVDLKDQMDFTLADPAVEPQDRVWSKSYSDENLEVVIINQSRLKIDLKPNKNGEVKLLFNVSDKKHYYIDSTFEFTIEILPVNDPPQIIQYFSSLVINEDFVNTDINLHEHFDDPIDNDELTFRVENNRNIDVELNQSTGAVTLTPGPNWFGIEYLDFFASDGDAEVSDYLKVIVKKVNDAPELRINETIELWQDQWANFTIDAFDKADNESVIINQNLTEIFPKLVNQPKLFGYSFDNTTGYLTLKPTNSMVGTYSWNISAVDIYNSLNYTHVTLIINNVNDPPVPTILYPATGARFLATDKIAFKGRVYDPDKVLKGIDVGPLTLTWYSTLHGERRRIGAGLNLEPVLYENGVHTITLSVFDGEFTGNTSIVISVFAINKDLDTDGDGIPDYWENLFSFNIIDPHDAKHDPDKDTFSNWEEYMAQTDPRDPNSFPPKHITEKETQEDEYLPIYIGIFVLLIIIMVLLILFIIIKARRKKREDQESAEKGKGADKVIDLSSEGRGRTPHGVYKQPRVVCHVCGKSFKILTLNRPVAITCPDCGSRGVVYK